jgi:hypothetical protein
MSLHTYDVPQQDPKWYALRCGLVTASAVGTLVSINPPDAITVDCPRCKATAGNPCLSIAASKKPTEIKSLHDQRTAAASTLPPVYGPADTEGSRNLIATLAAERITNHVEETWISNDMWRGIEAEPYAREVYAQHCTKEPVTECGFMIRDFGEFSIGYSPDGLVGDDGLLEIKAPRQKGHLTTVVSDEVPPYYMAQLQAGLLVSGREWIDYVSYSGGMHLWPKRVTPDPAWQGAILAAAERAERAIRDAIDTYVCAVAGLPLTERIDFNTVELKLA